MTDQLIPKPVTTYLRAHNIEPAGLDPQTAARIVRRIVERAKAETLPAAKFSSVI